MAHSFMEKTLVAAARFVLSQTIFVQLFNRKISKENTGLLCGFTTKHSWNITKHKIYWIRLLAARKLGEMRFVCCND